MELGISQYKWIGTMEAISFLLLLGVAMPLKYIWELPQAVSLVGMIHGLLFMLYIYASFVIKPKLGWNKTTLFIVLLCAVLPFGPFYAERKYLR